MPKRPIAWISIALIWFAWMLLASVSLALQATAAARHDEDHRMLDTLWVPFEEKKQGERVIVQDRDDKTFNITVIKTSTVEGQKQ